MRHPDYPVGDLVPELVAYWVQPTVVALIRKHQAYLLVNIGNEMGDDTVSVDQMAIRTLVLTHLSAPLAVSRLDPGSHVPNWAIAGEFCSVVRTVDELSIVCAEEAVPPGVTCQRGWRGLKVAGPLDFALTGVLASLAGPLAEAGVSIFAISTFDTDYLLVREEQLAGAIEALRCAGHTVA